jgi:5-oxopent-3-ene-1,2,5-tricarboxylate decarboxylase/2-hydroxyhepta-2,4-diene-1,7-dioate isomerase
MRVQGRVYGAALNFRGVLEALGDAVYQPPYLKPPQAPVLFIKPANTLIGNSAPIPCPAGVDRLRMGGTLAAVIGRTASRVPEHDALQHVAGYTIANDVSIPTDSFFRPPVLEKCRDGFCPLGPRVAALENPGEVQVRIFVDGALCATNTTAHLVRPLARLIADITEFMTLYEGDILLVGEPENAPLAGVGARVRVEIEGIGALENPIGAEGF